ncbi:Hypothetical predicted protein [Olea europaea subsp. europaea]|uniref:Uncharacterized protein n=1 Tax=Olea europaea subsp. europaea TaxID=158383 RepID=A0A8S0S708_OLEEU|nr:Hypothetical predicted protein [Olea europaea subsp. europaea]
MEWVWNILLAGASVQHCSSSVVVYVLYLKTILPVEEHKVSMIRGLQSRTEYFTMLMPFSPFRNQSRDEEVFEAGCTDLGILLSCTVREEMGSVFHSTYAFSPSRTSRDGGALRSRETDLWISFSADFRGGNGLLFSGSPPEMGCFQMGRVVNR